MAQGQLLNFFFSQEFQRDVTRLLIFYSSVRALVYCINQSPQSFAFSKYLHRRQSCISPYSHSLQLITSVSWYYSILLYHVLVTKLVIHQSAGAIRLPKHMNTGTSVVLLTYLLELRLVKFYFLCVVLQCLCHLKMGNVTSGMF